MTTTHDHCIDICNKLLRGERSAVETYDKAISKYGDEPLLDELSRIRADHQHAVTVLTQNVRSMGGTPEDGAGAWGAFANLVQGAANLFGADSALEALQNGEKSGRTDYQGALDDDEVLPECKALISSELLPLVEEHIVTLESLQKAT